MGAGGSVIAPFLWNGYSADASPNCDRDHQQHPGRRDADRAGGAGTVRDHLREQLLVQCDQPRSTGDAGDPGDHGRFPADACELQHVITTAVTQTIPNEIAQAVNGQPNLAGAQGFDALINATENFAAQVRAQASGFFYMSERFTVYISEGVVRFS